MKRSLLLAPLVCLALAACGQTGPTVTFEQQMRNPLFAERYWEELTDRMVQLHVLKDPLLQDPKLAQVAEETRVSALANAQAATKWREKGMIGAFQGGREETGGHALLLDGTLYLGTDFLVYPGPSLHIYVTTLLDPRAGTGATALPDAGSIDLGTVQNPYGAQEYRVPAKEGVDAAKLRTVVLWDTKLRRLYSFAQLAR
jgi:hypothetical protein